MKKILFCFVFTLCLLLSNILYVNADSDLDCSHTLKKGSNGSNVIVLQKKLNTAIKCDLEEDGVFGNLTKNCVIKFQNKYGLVADGIVGIKTCTKLNSLGNDKSGYYGVVTAELLNIRKSASVDANVIVKAKSGSVLKIIGSTNRNGLTWYKVNINGKIGYASSTYVKKTAIVLDISEQNFKYYKDGDLFINTTVVTGRLNKHDTPVGHFILNSSNKQRNRTLRGTNDDGSKYAAHVDYWMPFITSRAIGFHDASWRSNKEFNKETYKTNGSHGCVNMKSNDAKNLYNNISGKIDVIIKK